LARAVLENQAVRAAEAVPEADDRELLPRLLEPLQATIDVNADADHLGATKRMP
jgi:hypothetical protein